MKRSHWSAVALTLVGGLGAACWYVVAVRHFRAGEQVAGVAATVDFGARDCECPELEEMLKGLTSEQRAALTAKVWSRATSIVLAGGYHLSNDLILLKQGQQVDISEARAEWFLDRGERALLDAMGHVRESNHEWDAVIATEMAIGCLTHLYAASPNWKRARDRADVLATHALEYDPEFLSQEAAVLLWTTHSIPVKREMSADLEVKVMSVLQSAPLRAGVEMSYASLRDRLGERAAGMPDLPPIR